MSGSGSADDGSRVDCKPSKEEDYLQSISFYFFFNFNCMELIKKIKPIESAHRHVTVTQYAI